MASFQIYLKFILQVHAELHNDLCTSGNKLVKTEETLWYKYEANKYTDLQLSVFMLLL